MGQPLPANPINLDKTAKEEGLEYYIGEAEGKFKFLLGWARRY